MQVADSRSWCTSRVFRRGGRHPAGVVAVALGVALALPLRAETHFPEPDWRDAPNPIASPQATRDGGITTYAGQFPDSHNYYLANNTFCAGLFGLLFDTLLDLHPTELHYEPGLAAGWALSDDHLSFTFRIDPQAVWSDGEPITAADVQWTYDAIMKPGNLTGPHKVALGRFERPEVLDTHTVRFTAREVHWENLMAAGGFHILPRHVFAAVDFNTINTDFPVVSGPYRIETVREGIFTRLRRRDDWWRGGQARMRNLYNFDAITFRFAAESDNAFDLFRRQQIDLFSIHTARLWVRETQGERYDRNWIVRQQIHNDRPVGFQGFAMNMRRAPFDDLRVRQALAHLLDRGKLNRTMMYNQYFLHRSYFEDLYSDEHPCLNPAYDYNPARALELLQEAGWRTNPATGNLERNGEPLRIRFLTRAASAEQFLQVYNEDLKQAGILLTIDRKDWAAWSRDMNAYNYDMTWAAWSAGIFRNPESMWLSDEADREGGNNITGFKDAAVDALIERQKTMVDIHERNALLRELDARVTAACPYVLLWNTDATRLLYWNTFGTPPSVLSRYGDHSSALAYWWYDFDAAAELTDAMESGETLPLRPAVVRYEEAVAR